MTTAKDERAERISERKEATSDDGRARNDARRRTGVIAMFALFASAAVGVARFALGSRERSRAKVRVKDGDVIEKGNATKDEGNDRAKDVAARDGETKANDGGKESERRARARGTNEDDFLVNALQGDANGNDSGGNVVAPECELTPGKVKVKEVSTSSASRGRPALKLEVENTSSRGSTFVASLGIDEFTIGRGKVNALVVESAEASTVHAGVRWTGKAWELRDLGSLNGTQLNYETISVNDEKRAPGKWSKLSHGDTIKFGERETSPTVSVSFFRDTSQRAHEALSLRSVVRAEGSKPSGSEDRVLVECPVRGNPSVGVFCVFDGHGGFVASESARKIFPEVLARHLAGKVPDESGAKELLENVFLETDEIMGVEYEGCTATAVLVWKNPRTGGLTMQAANVGDSSAALGRVSVIEKSAHDAKYLTPEHKVRHKEERDRLNEAGAELPPEATRLYGLALSRALGDKFLKDQNVGLIARPFVSDPIDVNGTTDNAVLTIASDGIWDVITPKEMYDAMYDENIEGCLHATAQRMILEARRKRSVDDISFIGVCLDIRDTL